MSKIRDRAREKVAIELFKFWNPTFYINKGYWQDKSVAESTRQAYRNTAELILSSIPKFRHYCIWGHIGATIKAKGR